MSKLFALCLVVASAVVLAATAVSPASVTAKGVVVSTRKIPKLGTVLVNSKGMTLYMFVPDKQKRVTCKGTCAAVWPPLKLAKGAKAVAKGGAKASLLGSDPNPAGGRVVTYKKWPLYLYVGDSRPGQARGQALKLNGGLWYVLSPTGKVIRTKP
jgi:predicted lipoprotein with Yx(FWY)xxD motif